MVFQFIDGIKYKLQEPADISFISRYGKVFKVFDDQDSGNICFGTQLDGKRYFIKFAGVKTAEYKGKIIDAITRLKNSVSVYQELRHDNLIKLVFAEETGGGFAAGFQWSDGECMGKQYPQTREKFLSLPDKTKLGIFSDILDFHLYTVKMGYVAVDFYDGSIMYDFQAGKTVLCDIDFYQKQPFYNTMGRMWGSSRFMSPEEFKLGAPIDEITTVYLMGATAFALFGGETDHSFDKWRLNKSLYHIALKAVNPERKERYPALKQFSDTWNRAMMYKTLETNGFYPEQ